MPDFGSLEPQDVREYWAHEERDFTPWIADQLNAETASELENAIGLDIELIEREKPVGKYNVDIFAKAIDDERKIVIENQLARSDHDHLGKSIAYAAGVDADIIVWIAPEFNDEHKDAIQWLNTNSREHIDLFAIRLEVWRIDDSPPAVRFNPIQEPSEWKEKAQRSTGDLSDRDTRRDEFWTLFRDRITQTQTPLRARKPSPRHYYSNPIGVSGFHMSFLFDRNERERGITLYIEDDEDAFWELVEDQDQIEAELGHSLEWIEPKETRTGNMRSEIRLRTDGMLADKESWEDHIEWFLEYGERFHEVFSPQLRNLQ